MRHFRKQAISAAPAAMAALFVLMVTCGPGGSYRAHAAFPSLVFSPASFGDSDEGANFGRSTISLSQRRQPASLPDNPHAFMNSESKCFACHDEYRGDLQPHKFIVSITEMCTSCHGHDRIGRSHPVDVDPRYVTADVDVPEELPLEEGLVTCGSCHNPHDTYLSQTRSFDLQGSAFARVQGNQEVHYYKTYYLRISDPAKGFDPLCNGCHRNY